MAPTEKDDVTRLLEEARNGDGAAMETLLSTLYASLRVIAGRQMAGERAAHTLQPTALVHEAWLKLVGRREGVTFEDRRHFLGAAAEAMRQILVDHARARGRLKRGGEGLRRVPLEAVELATAANGEEILAVEDAIRRLSSLDARMAEIARLRLYADLSSHEIAAALGASERTVRRDWAFARAWLHRDLGPDEET